MSQTLLLADYEELGLTIANVFAGLYALLIVVALLFKAFRSWIGLVVALIGSAIVTLPAINAYYRVAKYPNVLQRHTITELTQIAVALLVFVWAAPILQYLIIRYRRRMQRLERLNHDG